VFKQNNITCTNNMTWYSLFLRFWPPSSMWSIWSLRAGDPFHFHVVPPSKPRWAPTVDPKNLLEISWYNIKKILNFSRTIKSLCRIWILICGPFQCSSRCPRSHRDSKQSSVSPLWISHYYHSVVSDPTGSRICGHAQDTSLISIVVLGCP
jgi:hypothetical protein